MEEQNFSIPAGTNEAFAVCKFTSGQSIALHAIKPPSGSVRSDDGFYYTPTANGSGVLLLDANGIAKLLHPYYAGSETTYNEIHVYVR